MKKTTETKITTETKCKSVFEECKELFIKKAKDYGPAWRVLRLPSITDQLLIKANRIRTIQCTSVHKVNESAHEDLIAIVNYGIIALIQLYILKNEAEQNKWKIPLIELENLYDDQVDETLKLLLDKNHDYGEVWQKMRVGSIIDIILMKLLRVKNIEDNNGETLISEGYDGNYRDIINYAIFTIIKLQSIKSLKKEE